MQLLSKERSLSKEISQASGARWITKIWHRKTYMGLEEAQDELIKKDFLGYHEDKEEVMVGWCGEEQQTAGGGEAGRLSTSIITSELE